MQFLVIDKGVHRRLPSGREYGVKVLKPDFADGAGILRQSSVRR